VRGALAAKAAGLLAYVGWGRGFHEREREREGKPLCDRTCGARSRVGPPGEVYEIVLLASYVVLVSVVGLLSSNR
jgi:hypothetical protein